MIVHSRSRTKSGKRQSVRVKSRDIVDHPRTCAQLKHEYTRIGTTKLGRLQDVRGEKEKNGTSSAPLQIVISKECSLSENPKRIEALLPMRTIHAFLDDQSVAIMVIMNAIHSEHSCASYCYPMQSARNLGEDKVGRFRRQLESTAQLQNRSGDVV